MRAARIHGNSDMKLLTDALNNCWRTSTIALVAIAIYLVLGAVPEQMVLDRSVSQLAEPWRLFTAHLAHCDIDHVLWDCTGLVLVGLIYEPILHKRLWQVLVVSALTIDAAVFVLAPEILRYCGLSGLINAVVGAGIAAAWFERRDPLLLGFGLLIATKVAIENLTATPLLTDTHWPPLHLAHLVGFLAGLAIVAAMHWRARFLESRPEVGAPG